jgi:kynurenine formamidase
MNWVQALKVYDLGRELSEETPHHPNHVPLMHRLTKVHGDVVDAHGISASNDMVTMGTHIGTHIDGLGHIACGGVLAHGLRAEDVSTRLAGYSAPIGIDTLEPIVIPGVVADVPRLLGVDELAPDHLVTARELEDALRAQRAPIPDSGALYIRTGWGRDWPHVAPAHHASPGPGEEAVLWAWERGARLFGSDTLSFERLPNEGLPVHRALLVDRGAHIIEALDLEALCADAAWEFVTVVAPLRLRGGTASPVRPLALVST